MNAKHILLALGAAAAIASGLTLQDSKHPSQPAAAKPAPKQPAKNPTKTPAAKPADPPAETRGHGADAQPSDNHAADSDTPADPHADGQAQASPEPTQDLPPAQAALAMLQAGNGRWVTNATLSPHTEPDLRRTLAMNGQTPSVSILTCADSRIPVERVFDAGVGDVFVVRVAGNVAGDSEVGTIEYGVGHLHTPLLVVMGHTKCGAVAAAASGAELHGMVGKLVAHIAPAVDRAQRQNPDATEQEIVAAAVRENVWQTVFDLYRASPECRDLVESGRLTVVGAVLDISTGRVDWLGEHPWETEILSALNAQDAAAQHADASHAAGHNTEHNGAHDAGPAPDEHPHAAATDDHAAESDHH